MSGDDEFEEKTDLTRIEDLSEFLHQIDPDIDAQLDTSKEKAKDEPPAFEELPSLNDLTDSEDFEEEVESFDMSSSEEDTEEEDSQEFPSFESTEDFESDSNEDTQEDFQVNAEESAQEDTFGSSEEDTFESSDSEESTFESSDDEENLFESEEDDSFSMEAETEDDSLDEEDSFTSNENFEDAIETTDEESVSEENSFESVDSFNDDDDADETEEVATEDELATNTFTEEFSEPTPAVAQKPIHIDRSEKFEDIKAFAKNITYGKIAVGGNPAFSVVLRNIKYEEDAEDIMILLGEHDLIDQVGEESIKQSLESGSLLISQISEFSAIYLTHKFRRFDLDIQMGLSDELHPSKSYERDSVGLVSKSRVNQNKNETTRLESSNVDIDSVILSTTPTLESYKIIEYLGVVTEFVVISQEELVSDSQLSEIHDREAKGHLDSQIEEDEKNDEIDLNHSNIYKDLSEKLRPQCMKKNANAVVGINYQITPISNGQSYKVSCSGSAVWVIDNI